MNNQDEKHYVEIELVAGFLGDQIVIDDAAYYRKEHLIDEWAAEVSIPYHTEDTVYCLIVWILTTPASQPALEEMFALEALAGQIIQDRLGGT